MGGVKKESLILGRSDFLAGNISESDSDIDSSSESELEDIPTSEPSNKAIYNKEGILDKLEDIKWPENIDWIHKLTIDHDQDKEIDVNDDIVRELAFYTQALEGTRQAFAKINPLGIPFFRPSDYYAEMVKTDIHMLKIKGRLLDQKKKIEEAEERKKAREAKKMAKEVQALKLKERAKQKKEDIESVKKWRKQRQQSGFPDRGRGDGDLDLDFDGGGFGGSKKSRPGVSPGDRSGGAGKKGLAKKREKRNSKFGYGGRKGMKKQNTAETTDDLRGFNRGGGSASRKRKNR